jgi:tetratricopeptide (TPR) repeat protein
LTESIESDYGAEHNATVFAMSWTSEAMCIRPGADADEINLALRYAARACELRPQASNHWLSLAMAQYRSATYAEALEALNQHQQLSSKQDVIASFFRAMTLWQLDRRNESRQQLLAAKEILRAIKKTNHRANVIAVEASELIDEPDVKASY